MKPSEILRAALDRANVSTHRLASDLSKTGKPVCARTINNVSCGNSKSRSLRRRITDYLQDYLHEPIWPDTQIERLFELVPGEVEFDCVSEDAAAQFEREFPAGYAERVGQVVRILKPISVTLSSRPATSLEPVSLTKPTESPA